MKEKILYTIAFAILATYDWAISIGTIWLVCLCFGISLPVSFLSVTWLALFVVHVLHIFIPLKVEGKNND